MRHTADAHHTFLYHGNQPLHWVAPSRQRACAVTARRSFLPFPFPHPAPVSVLSHGLPNLVWRSPLDSSSSSLINTLDTIRVLARSVLRPLPVHLKPRNGTSPQRKSELVRLDHWDAHGVFPIAQGSLMREALIFSCGFFPVRDYPVIWFYCAHLSLKIDRRSLEWSSRYQGYLFRHGWRIAKGPDGDGRNVSVYWLAFVLLVKDVGTSRWSLCRCIETDSLVAGGTVA